MPPNRNSSEEENTPPSSDLPQQPIISPRIIQPLSSEAGIRAAVEPPKSSALSSGPSPTSADDILDPNVVSSNQQQDALQAEPSYYDGSALVAESLTHQTQQPGVSQVKAGKKIKPYMWILFGAIFLVIVLPIILVSMQNLLGAKTDDSRLVQAGENMSVYLHDKYGIRFNVQDVKYLTNIKTVHGIKVITANVSPANDPSFSYTASAYLHSALPGQKDDPTYKEDFLGEYWKSGFEKSVCPSVRSIKVAFSVTKCSLTSSSLGVDYRKVLAQYRGNVPSFSQLNETDRKLLTFGLTIESLDNNNLSNIAKHVEFLEQSSNIINTTHAESVVMYFSNSTNDSDPRLGFMGTLGDPALNEKMPIINKIFKQAADEHKSVLSKNRLYYNTRSSAFDLSQPQGVRTE